MPRRAREQAPADGACRHESAPHLSWPRARACEECGSRFNLRVCTSCGHVGCCESQLGHNKEHWRESGHAVIRSLPIEDGSFTWCYECRAYL
ncbi:MAG: UBP-type zinc finger domain-containing protein [Actinobacteria bacterium]|nr:UBP-type zinc finger domain-containing protein [Actinomycetota bacterium]